MKNFVRIASLLILGLIISGYSKAQMQNIVMQIDTFLDNLDADHNINGNVLIAGD
ncbi:hypothetical protein [Sphingobacterium sp. G1-14]|nr:hypothetical protein [Sphingobacterium sp. G1-14]